MRIVKVEVNERRPPDGCFCRWRWCECPRDSGRYSVDVTYEVHRRADFKEGDDGMVGMSAPALERDTWTHQGEGEPREWAHRGAARTVELAMKRDGR